MEIRGGVGLGGGELGATTCGELWDAADGDAVWMKRWSEGKSFDRDDRSVGGNRPSSSSRLPRALKGVLRAFPLAPSSWLSFLAHAFCKRQHRTARNHPRRLVYISQHCKLIAPQRDEQPNNNRHMHATQRDAI